MGPKTRAALIEYQKDHGLQQTGGVDTSTQESLGIKFRGIDTTSKVAAPKKDRQQETDSLLSERQRKLHEEQRSSKSSNGRDENRNQIELRRYLRSIQRTIQDSWRPPSNTKPGITCKVLVTQNTRGIVLDVRVESCSGGGTAMRDSVEKAVLRASPLPTPRNPDFFDTRLRITLRFDA